MNVDFQQLQADVITIKGMLTALVDQHKHPVNSTPPDEVLTVGEAAELLNLTSATIYGLVF